ncbi:MAG: hypothetical protein ACLQM8_25865 [Limisphaerales bacterium]
MRVRFPAYPLLPGENVVVQRRAWLRNASLSHHPATAGKEDREVKPGEPERRLDAFEAGKIEARDADSVFSDLRQGLRK